MAPGLQLVLKMKVDELFLRWLSEPATQHALHHGLRTIRDAHDPTDHNPSWAPCCARDTAPAGLQPPGPPLRPTDAMPAPGKPGHLPTLGAGHPGAQKTWAPATPMPAGLPDHILESLQVRQAQHTATDGTQMDTAEVHAGRPCPLPAGPPVPAFFFPHGRPRLTQSVEAAITCVEDVFAQLPHERASLADMGRVAKACGCPLYWKAPLFFAAGGEWMGSVSVHKFIAMWRNVLLHCHDDAAKFVQLLMSPGTGFLEPQDFMPLLQDVVSSHPGLSFLRDVPEFHSHYITTVVQRIFYMVNRSWSGRITCGELRRSNFLQSVAQLEEEVDINRLTAFFSYEHFYVLYCKFWELDTDHDLLISPQDLARHNDHAISLRMIERIFSGAVTRGRRAQTEGKLSYEDFVWFLISEEDKKTPTSIEYWFRLMDLDGDGVLSMFELEHFYQEQALRLDALGLDALPFPDILCQMLDLVRPRVPGRVTLGDLKACRQAHVFFNTFFNLEKYLDQEQQEQASPFRDVEGMAPDPSDWDRYAAEEYAALLAEEAADGWDDGFKEELSPKAKSPEPPTSPPGGRPFLLATHGHLPLLGWERGEQVAPDL